MPKTQKSKIKGVTFGNDVSLVEPVNLYNCFLDDSVFVGPFVEIQSDVKIGKRTKIQSHSFIFDINSGLIFLIPFLYLLLHFFIRILQISGISSFFSLRGSKVISIRANL